MFIIPDGLMIEDDDDACQAAILFVFKNLTSEKLCVRRNEVPEPETKQEHMTVHSAASYANASKEIQNHRDLHNHASLW